MPILMYRVSTVYVPYINRISTVVYSGGVAEGKRSLAGRAVVGSLLRCKSGKAL